MPQCSQQEKRSKVEKATHGICTRPALVLSYLPELLLLLFSLWNEKKEFVILEGNFAHRLCAIVHTLGLVCVAFFSVHSTQIYACRMLESSRSHNNSSTSVQTSSLRLLAVKSFRKISVKCAHSASIYRFAVHALCRRSCLNAIIFYCSAFVRRQVCRQALVKSNYHGIQE